MLNRQHSWQLGEGLLQPASSLPWREVQGAGGGRGGGGHNAAATANSFPKARLLFREYNYILIYVCRLFSLKVIIISTSISNV